MGEAGLQAYKTAWIRLKTEVLDEKTGWGKEELKKRMVEILTEEMENCLEQLS